MGDRERRRDGVLNTICGVFDAMSSSSVPQEQSEDGQVTKFPAYSSNAS